MIDSITQKHYESFELRNFHSVFILIVNKVRLKFILNVINYKLGRYTIPSVSVCENTRNRG